jgi:transcriptional regulator with XRE-family HTH domain
MPDLKPATPLRVARVRAGWRLGALADKVGLNETSLWRIEAGRTKKPKSKTRQKLAAVLKVKEAVLFGKVGE